jgi:uncharacterized protein
MRRMLVGLVLWAALCLQFDCAAAQDTGVQQPVDGPLMGSEATALPAADQVSNSSAEDGDGYSILVIGDALAGGLGAGMTRMVQELPSFEILNRFNESSGLARREVYDWSAALGKIVATKPVKAVVVLVGVNDRQEIRDGSVRYPFKSPQWVKGYEANVDQLITAIKASQAEIFWVSVPPMADAGFDADMRYLSDIHKARVAAHKGHYIDVRPFFQTADGAFVERGPDDTGVERKLRDSDGVRFMKSGNNRFGQVVLEGIRAQIKNLVPPQPAIAAAPEAVVANDPPAAGQGVTIVAEPPSFGQSGLDGESLTFRADSLKAPALPQVSVAQRTAGQNVVAAPSMQISAIAGSAAEKFLTDGVVGTVPAGRFDDYAVPAAAP